MAAEAANTDFAFILASPSSSACVGGTFDLKEPGTGNVVNQQ